MNTLGQLKVLHEIRAIRGVSGQSNDTNGIGNQQLFDDLLKEVISQQNTSTQGTPFNPNSLGAISQLNHFSHFHFNHINTVRSSELLAQISTSNSPSHIDDIIKKAAATYQLPEKLIKSVIKHESNFNEKAVSRAGASGLMQLMPQTANGLGVTDIFDPFQNVMGGSKYLRNMLNKYNGDLKLALAAYNAGPGNVDKYGGVPPFKETQAYVKKVMNTYYS